MGKVAQPLLEDEVRGRAIWELAGNIADSLRTPELLMPVVLDVVYETTTDMLRSKFNDFFPAPEHPAAEATCHDTMAFLADKFRDDLTTATNGRPRHQLPLLEVDGAKLSENFALSMVSKGNHTGHRKLS